MAGLRPGTYRLRARLLGWQEVEMPVTLAGRKPTTQNVALTPVADANEQLPASQFLSCAAWSTEDGPGELASGFLVEEDPQAGDTANANLLAD